MSDDGARLRWFWDRYRIPVDPRAHVDALLENVRALVASLGDRAHPPPGLTDGPS